MNNRNDPTGLVMRSMKNLQALESVASTGADVHPITQLVVSLLAMIVFPKERAEFNGADYQIPLSTLEEAGWPVWHHLERGEVQTLAHLLVSLRHAISHGQVAFSSESRNYDEVNLRFTNRPKGKLKWQGEISAADLRVFCDRLSRYILSRG